MIICNKCGAGLDNNSRYCGQCGDKCDNNAISLPNEASASPVFASHSYCCKCGARLPEDCVSCLICGTDAGVAPPPDEPEPPVEKSRAPEKIVRKHPKRLMAVCLSICVILALSSASIWFIQSFPGMGSANVATARGAIIYLTDDGLLKYKVPSMDMPQDIARDYRAETKISGLSLAKIGPNGRYIAYLNEYFTVDGIASGQLLVRDLGKKSTADSNGTADLLISENVTSQFFFNSNNTTLIFLTADGRLSATDFIDNRLLDEGVYEIIDHTDTQILYSKKTGEALSVYIINQAANPGVEKVLVDDNIISLSDYTPAFDKFIYLRENPNGSHDAVSYDVKLDKRQPLAVGVGDIIAVDARTSSVLYQTSVENPLHYDNLIDDEFAVSDEKIEEPDLADYPLLEEFVDKYGVDADYEGSVEHEEIIEERAGFLAASDNYAEKVKRDRFRKDIRDIIDSFVAEYPLVYDLHFARDGETVKLAGGSYSPFNDAELDINKGFAVWQTTSLKGFKKTALTRIPDTFSANKILDSLNRCVSDTVYLQQFGYATAPVYLGDGQFYSTGWRLTEKGDGIYFAMGDGSPFAHSDNACKLYYASIQAGSVGHILQVDENVAAIGPMLSGNRLLYFKERIKDSCDLYLMNGVTSEQIGDNISLLDEYFKIENDGKTLLYSEHFNKANESGNMFMLAEQSRQLTTEVHRVFYRNDLLVYFLRSYNDGKAELYSFGSGGLSRIDENVIAVME